MRITIARTSNKAWFRCGYHAYFTYGERHTLLMTSSLLFVVFYRSAGGELHEIPVPPADYLPSLFHVYLLEGRSCIICCVRMLDA
jgi:hypothetical protein